MARQSYPDSARIIYWRPVAGRILPDVIITVKEKEMMKSWEEKAEDFVD